MGTVINNNSTTNPAAATDLEEITKDDAAWILANAFLILTMQTGFGMLEAGNVSSKNIANIMVKNVIDVTVGGITYWTFGFALSFGRPSNWFCGYGNFFFNAEKSPKMGTLYTQYIFQFSFATAATTIVSGAVAERIKLSAYICFSAINTLIYCIPASWAWNETGFLAKLGFFDFAGAGVVHMTGGASALIAATMLGPRIGQLANSDNMSGEMSSPVTALTGAFMLWWAWMSFNCGSTFGINGNLWRIAAKVAVNTLNGSIGGSFAGLFCSILVNRRKIYFDISFLINSILGGLVGITAACSIITPMEALFIGFVGGCVALGSDFLFCRFKIDDPVSAAAVHFVGGVWGVAAVGLFRKDNFEEVEQKLQGVFRGGNGYLLAVQILGVVSMTIWSMLMTFLVFTGIKHTIGMRMNTEDEILGADWVEHRVKSENFAAKLEKAMNSLRITQDEQDQLAMNILQEITQSKENGQIVDVDQRIRNYTSTQKCNVVHPESVPPESSSKTRQQRRLSSPAAVEEGHENEGESILQNNKRSQLFQKIASTSRNLKLKVEEIL